jgi:hypothetical protein
MIGPLFALLAATSALAGENPFDLPLGGSGFKLLKASASPRDQALSGAGAGGPGIETSANPATDSADHTTISAGWIEDYGQLGGSQQDARWEIPYGAWTAEGRLRYQGFSNIPGRDDQDQITGNYAASTWALEGGASAPLPLEGLRAGFLLGAGMDAVSDATSWGGWISGGLRWAPAQHPWAAGIEIQNLGMGTLSGQYRERLPAVVQAGVSWTQRWGDWAVIPMADLRLVADETPVVPVALEARWNGISLRTGFPVGRPEAMPSFGLGYLGDSWGIDAGLGWHAALGFAPSGQITLRF